MNKSLIVILSSALLISSAFAKDEVVATFKGGDVKESQIVEYITPILAEQNVQGKKFADFSPMDQENIVRMYVRTKVIEQEAKHQGIESSKAFQEKLNNIKTRLLSEELLSKQLENVVTDKMIDEEYNNMVTFLKGSNEIKVSHILVATEAEAKEIKAQLTKDPKKFAAIAKKSSKDESTKIKGGEIGYVTKGQLLPEFENAAMALKVGAISDPVQTQFGWHIIKVLDKRPVSIPSKEEARNSLTMKIKNEAAAKYIKELEDKYNVKVTLPAKTN